MTRPSSRHADARRVVVPAGAFASAVRAASRGADAVGREAMLLDVAPSIAMALPSVIVVFAATSQPTSLAMIERITAAVASCQRSLGSAPPVAVMDSDTRRGRELAEQLGVELRGRGETCWLVEGTPIARGDVVADDSSLRELTLGLARRAVA